MLFPTLAHQYLENSAERLPEKTALIFGEERWTYRQINETAGALATSLRQMGLQRQDRVAILMDNCCEAVISIYGTLKAGGAFVMLSGSLKAPKLAYILDNSSSRILIVHSSKRSVVDEALASLRVKPFVIWVGGSERASAGESDQDYRWASMIEQGRGSETALGVASLPRCIDLDLAALIYTSGSTGEPKGVIEPHANMLAAARSITEYIGNREDDIVLDVLPLSFDYGLYQVIMAFMYGGTIVLERSFTFLHEILLRVGRERVTGFPIVPTIAAMLLKMKDLSNYDLSSLRYLTNTGAALPVKHIQELRALFPQARLFSMFGLTECKRVCYLPPEELDRRPGSVGKAMSSCETMLLDEEGRQVAPCEIGELVIRGSNVMRGYWRDPQMTARVYRPGRTGETLLYSGDYFRTDEEGFLYFVGRKDDMIKCKGERVSPKEIENTLCDFEGVAEAAVIGVPDEILGQAIVAFIVPAPGCQIAPKTILKHCSERLESFAQPKIINLVDALPKTPNGKIDKKSLKALASSADLAAAPLPLVEAQPVEPLPDSV